MKRIFVIFLLMPFGATAQKAFYSESFSSDQLPAGWVNVDSSGQGCAWVVTNQPYPGSFGYQRQAPPIASSSSPTASVMLVAIPAGVILKRIGFSVWWALLCFIPAVALPALWLVAFVKWPRDATAGA